MSNFKFCKSFFYSFGHVIRSTSHVVDTLSVKTNRSIETAVKIKLKNNKTFITQVKIKSTFDFFHRRFTRSFENIVYTEYYTPNQKNGITKISLSLQ